MCRQLLALLLFFCSLRGAEAAADERAAEIVAIHFAAIGGRGRVEALKAFRTSGTVRTGGQLLRFVVVAARPDRLRLEFSYDTGTLIQASDGTNPPWEVDTRPESASNRLMGPSAAAAFLANTDFDDPLVSATLRGDTIEYAGSATLDGRAAIRLLVTRKLSRSFLLLLDAETYYILSRIERHPGAETVTEYRDYRPVAGVLLAHSVKVWENGELAEDARLAPPAANPRLAPDTFTRPPPGK